MDANYLDLDLPSWAQQSFLEWDKQAARVQRAKEKLVEAVEAAYAEYAEARAAFEQFRLQLEAEAANGDA